MSIRALQTLLHELGFGEELSWQKYGADGDYGNATVKAVSSFKRRNGLKASGRSVSIQVAKVLLTRFDSLDELQQLNNDLRGNRIGGAYYRGSKDKNAIAALQTLLNDLGFGKQLKWSKYRNDGDYGNATVSALSAFAKKSGISTSGSKLSKKLAQLIISKLKVRYGDGWRTTGKTAAKIPVRCALSTFTGSNFVGKKVVADNRFLPALKRINGFAKKHDVLVHVTSSFRTTTNVKGAIVTPARMSNHLAGHAIDMNLRYGPNHANWCNSACLRKRTLPAPVKGFIGAIRKDAGLRWGGDFRTKDPVHIDDHLNKDKSAWAKRYKATQIARQSGCG